MSADDRIAEIEARRSARKADLAAKKQEQLAIDLEALDSLEVEYGDDAVKRVDPNGYSPGLPSFIVVRRPTGAEFKRYQDMAKVKSDGKHGDSVKAANLLADVCVVYPTGETYSAMKEAFPGLHVSAGVASLLLAAAQAVDEGKG